MGNHHGLDAAQPPRKQAQEVVLVVCVQCEAEGSLGRHRRAGASVGLGPLGGRMWSWGLGRKRTGYYAPGEMTERQRGSERQMRALAVNDEQVHGWTRGCMGTGGSVDA